MPTHNLKGGKVFNISLNATKDTIIANYLLYISYQGSFLTDYTEGDIFNTSGLLIVAHFIDGSSEVLSSNDEALWKYFPTSPLTAETKYITVIYSYYDKTATCLIPINVTKLYVSEPRLENQDFVYNGQELSPNIIGYDERYMTMTGDLLGINAGTYTITFTIIDDRYKFPNGKTTYNLEWEIKKAVRPLSLSQDILHFENGYELGTPVRVQLNYPGEIKYNHKNIGGTSNIFLYQFDDSDIDNSKSFTVTVWNLGTNGRLKVEFWIDADDNYLESEHIVFMSVISFWEWGNETAADTVNCMNNKWITGMMDYISANGADEAWIGKTKQMEFRPNNGTGAFLTSVFNYTGTGNYLSMRCIDVNKDAPNSVTFMAAYTGYEKQQFNQSDDSEWPKKVDMTSDPTNYLLNLLDYIVGSEYGLLGVIPGLEYLASVKKVYWTGAELKTFECKTWVPSASELGVTAEEYTNYIGGQGMEYTDGKHSPYAYFISPEKRISKEYDTNNPVAYWTRSTADNGNKSENNKYINADQIIIGADGTPSALNKTTSSSLKACAYPIFICCYALPEAGGDDIKNGDSV